MREIVEITLDFETYYSKKEKYSLSAKGMTYEKYIRNPKFEIIGLAVKEFNRPAQWLTPHEIQDWLDYVAGAYGWENVRVIAHNGRFDMAILGWIYNVYPYQVADTMLMSRACQLWDGHSLDNVTKQLRERYRWGVVKNERGATMWGIFDLKDLPDTLDKGEEVHNADGKHLMDFTDEEYDAYGMYAMTDVDLTYSAYQWFMTQRKFPEKEIDVMTLTIEMFTYPVIELHKPVLLEVEKEVNGKRQALLDKVGATVEDLRSDANFAQMLQSLGVTPPMKLNTKGEKKYAFAKKDLAFLKLLEHEDPNVVELVEARLGNKSSQAVTRVQSLLELADRGLMPIPLEYYAAHTGRWGGCLVADTMVLVKSGDLITWKPICTVKHTDLVFDGTEFVEHKGVEFRGIRPVINYAGICGTYNHPIRVEDKFIPLGDLREKNILPSTFRLGIALLDYHYVGLPDWWWNYIEWNSYKKEEAVYDIVDCGAKSCFAIATPGGMAIVHNSDSINLQNFNRNQLVTSDTPKGTKVFYADKADAVVEVLPDGNVYLARAGVVKNEEELLHVMGLRDALKAPKGYKLCVQDLSSIELRMNSWLCGEQWILDALVSGKDIYKVTAASTYGIAYEDVTKSQRFVGKSQQLGLGYGAGVNGLKVVMGKRSEEFTDDELQGFVNAYRAAAPNIVRGWKQCKSALGAMVSGVQIQFCKDDILYTDGQRIALPNGLHLTYRDIHTRPGDMGNEFWFWGKNKQTKKPDWEKTFAGKIDENCIAEDTEVLTDRGWVKIQDVKLTDKVHDGVEFVTHKGILFKSVKECVNIDGVYMTTDHEVLTNDGWKQAGVLLSERSTSSIQRLNRTTLRELGCTGKSETQANVVLALPMRLWQNLRKRSAGRKEITETEQYSELWLSFAQADKREEQNARNGETSYLCDMACDEATLYAAEPQSVAQLRWSGYNSLSEMARQFRELSRRYVPYLPERFGFRSYKQRRELRTNKLSMGRSQGKLLEPTKNSMGRYARRNTIKCDGLLSKVWARAYNSFVSLIERGKDATTRRETERSKKVYDILDCGKRNRFVVRGETEPFIVHNCTQALCRIIMADIMLAIREDFHKREWTRDDAHLCLTVHDEVIVCCKDELAEEVNEIMRYRMSQSPSWCSTLPLACDGDIAQRYGCAK